MDKNVCPYCGSDDVHVGIGCDDKWGAFCNSCDAEYNSRKATPSEAVDVFCNPTYLLNKTGLIRLAADEVVVKRDVLTNAAALYEAEISRLDDGIDYDDPDDYAIQGHMAKLIVQQDDIQKALTSVSAFEATAALDASGVGR